MSLTVKGVDVSKCSLLLLSNACYSLVFMRAASFDFTKSPELVVFVFILWLSFFLQYQLLKVKEKRF